MSDNYILHSLCWIANLEVELLLLLVYVPLAEAVVELYIYILCGSYLVVELLLLLLLLLVCLLFPWRKLWLSYIHTYFVVVVAAVVPIW